MCFFLRLDPGRVLAGLLGEISTRPKFQGEAVVKASGLLLVSEPSYYAFWKERCSRRILISVTLTKDRGLCHLPSEQGSLAN